MSTATLTRDQQRSSPSQGSMTIATLPGIEGTVFSGRLRGVEQARRAERAAEYDRAFAASWRERAQQASDANKANRERFAELLAEEPWFMAYMESRAERYKREKIMHAAQRVQSANGQSVTVPEPRIYDLRLVDDLIETVERMAVEIGEHYAEELDAKRTAYIEATD